MLNPVSPLKYFSNVYETQLSSLLSAVCSENVVQSQKRIELGGVYIDKKRQLSDGKIFKGAVVGYHQHCRRFLEKPIQWSERIVSSNDEYLWINKPLGLPVHPTCDNVLENVSHQLALHCGRPVYLVHRLDIETEGLMVFAFNKEAQRTLQAKWREREVSKSYRALVSVPPPLGTLVHYQNPKGGTPKEISSTAHVGWKVCRLTIEKVKQFGQWFEIEISLMTGRHHQIRSQLADIGSPILNDTLYGGAMALSDCKLGIALQSKSLGFTDGQGIHVETKIKRPIWWEKQRELNT